MRLSLVILPCVLLLSVCDGYRILGLFPFEAKSHFMMFEHLMRGLARKGHQVDVVSTFPLKKPHENYTDLIILPKMMGLMNNFTYAAMNSIVRTSVIHAVSTIGGNDICKNLGHPKIQKIVQNPPKDPPYDVVIMEIFGAHCFAIIGHLLKVPIIGVSSSAIYPWSNDIIANPENLAFMPNNLLSWTNRMNFWQRFYNVAHTIYSKMYFNYMTNQQDEDIRKYFGANLPGVRELERKVALILTNSHISMNGIRPMTPALVEVGGLHVREEGVELPASLEKWMNESKHGFIYFTFGSMVMIESFPAKYLEIFYNSLGKIAPVRVLMKIPNPSLLPPGLPKNILTLQWMPQIKVLKHPNVKAFITHGGLMGTQEAIYCGVPLIGIPLFADQFINIDTYVAKNIAIKLDLETLTEEKMDTALNEILKNPIYRDTMQKVSRKFKDRPMSPIDTANYWIEYIIRHGEDALRSPALDLSWWQVELWDVYAAFLLILVTLVAVSVIAVRHLLNLLNTVPTFDVSSTKKVS